MNASVWVLTFNWYMGIDGSGSSILGIYTTEQKAEEAKLNYLKNREIDLADEDYNSEWLEIDMCFIDLPAKDY